MKPPGRQLELLPETPAAPKPTRKPRSSPAKRAGRTPSFWPGERVVIAWPGSLHHKRIGVLIHASPSGSAWTVSFGAGHVVEVAAVLLRASKPISSGALR